MQQLLNQTEELHRDDLAKLEEALEKVKQLDREHEARGYLNTLTEEAGEERTQTLADVGIHNRRDARSAGLHAGRLGRRERTLAVPSKHAKFRSRKSR